MSTLQMYQYHHEWKDSKESSSSGWHIKSIRELSNLSIDSVSQATGIAIERLLAAEENKIQLDIEECHKLAIAVNSHPSFFAFPSWGYVVPFKAEPVVVSGSIRVNTASEISEIRVYFYRESNISISLSFRKSLSIHAFNVNMATINNWKPQDINYRITGSDLGSLNDNYGGGADFDCDNRVITELEINIQYTANGIHYSFEGLAIDAGNVSARRPADSPAGDWTFSVSFLVPLEKLRAFCGLYPEAAEGLIARLKGYA